MAGDVIGEGRAWLTPAGVAAGLAALAAITRPPPEPGTGPRPASTEAGRGRALPTAYRKYGKVPGRYEDLAEVLDKYGPPVPAAVYWQE